MQRHVCTDMGVYTCQLFLPHLSLHTSWLLIIDQSLLRPFAWHSTIPLILFFQAHQTWWLGKQRVSSALQNPWVRDAVCYEHSKKALPCYYPLTINGKWNTQANELLGMNICLCVFFSLQWWQVEKVNPIKLYEENKVIAGFSLLNLLFKHRKCSLVKSVMDKLLSLYDQKKIKPVVDSLWALEEVRSWGDWRV